MEDKDIVQLYWDRNERAIAETSVKYGRYCTSIAMNILNNHEDAEECVNETYLNTWNTIPPHKPSMLSTFLGKIVRNLSFNKYKHTHSIKRGGDEISLILDELSEVVSGKESVEDDIIRNELIKTVDDFINTLSENKRYIFIRRYWYSDNITAIANQCGRTENSIYVELSRIRKKLRDYLTERDYDI
ncbi:MAG: sigma-70 family RNA polymerase sigma factor [Ruminococcus sp.]|nr:sigma-70 family RNA polymerase sigma factor [Ruminococcus sp.]MDE6788659.1 sigma-70 family RNA polymerase sigma factor [Ruminococcus sp.]